MTYKSRLDVLVTEAVSSIIEKIETNGVESKHHSFKVVKITDENLMFNLDGGRYLTEISTEYLIDNRGYTYSFFALDTEDLIQVADHISTQ